MTSFFVNRCGKNELIVCCAIVSLAAVFSNCSWPFSRSGFSWRCKRRVAALGCGAAGRRRAQQHRPLAVPVGVYVSECCFLVASCFLVTSVTGECSTRRIVGLLISERRRSEAVDLVSPRRVDSQCWGRLALWFSLDVVLAGRCRTVFLPWFDITWLVVFLPAERDPFFSFWSSSFPSLVESFGGASFERWWKGLLQFRLVGTAITRPRRRGPFVCDLPAPDPGDLSRHARDSYRRCQGCRARGLRSTGVSTTGSIHHRCGRVPHYNRALPSLDRVLPSFFTEFFFLSLSLRVAWNFHRPTAMGRRQRATCLRPTWPLWCVFVWAVWFFVPGFTRLTCFYRVLSVQITVSYPRQSMLRAFTSLNSILKRVFYPILLAYTWECFKTSSSDQFYC